MEEFIKEAEKLINTIYGIKLSDITDNKQIRFFYEVHSTPYTFICYLADKYDLQPIK